MFIRKITGLLLASSMLAAVSVSPVYADTSDKTQGTNDIKYEAEYDLGSEDHEQDDHFELLTEKIEDEDPELTESRKAADLAADAAEEAADEALGQADETDGEEIDEMAGSAAEHAGNARAAADLAGKASDGRTIELAVEIAESARTAAEEDAQKAVEAAEKEKEEARKAEEARAAAEEEERKAKALASAEYLGNFTLTAYCNCARCCGTAGNATASGVMPTSGHTVAMGGIDFGTKLLINGTVYTVEDRGTPYGHVDIFMDSHEEALQFGMSSADVYLVSDY